MALPEPGVVVERRRAFTQQDFDRFAALSGDHNPIHVDPGYAAATRFGRPVAHGMLLCSAIAGVIAEAFPEAVAESQSVMFPAPTYADEDMKILVTVRSAEGEKLSLDVEISDPHGRSTCTGEVRLRWDPR
jgi:acyl dehydratase